MGLVHSSKAMGLAMFAKESSPILIAFVFAPLLARYSFLFDCIIKRKKKREKILALVIVTCNSNIFLILAKSKEVLI